MRVLRCCSAAILVLLVGCSKEPNPVPAPAAPPAAASAPSVAPAAAAREAVFSMQELDQMLAPVALYPDPLLAQLLMAATYPGDFADAVAWSKAHADAKGDEAVLQVASQPWDPSVQALVAFPQALATLGQDLAWVQRLGDAFLAQPEDVMDAVQRLRRQAQQAGNLQSNEYQKVDTQPAAPPAAGATYDQGQDSSSQTIIIEPTNPEVVYVPSYDPTQAYGSWGYPDYPPVYYPPPPYYYQPGSALLAGMAFGIGVGITNSLWGDFDWDDDDIDIDIDSYNNVNVNRQLNVNQNNWNHNSINRDGVPYRDRNNREQNGRRMEGSQNRDAFRGDDPARAAARERSRESVAKRGIEAPATTNREARDRAQSAGQQSRETRPQGGQRQQAGSQQSRDNRPQGGQRQQAGGQQPRAKQTQSRDTARRQSSGSQGPRDNAFSGASKPSQSRQQASRGQASRSSSQRSGSSRSSGQSVQRQSKSSSQRSSRGGNR